MSINSAQKRQVTAPGESSPGIDKREVFYRAVIVVATLVGAFLLYRLIELVAILFTAVIFASALRPVVEFLVRRGVRRSVATLSIYAALIVGVLALLIVIIPPLVGMLTELISDGLLFDSVNNLVGKLFMFGWNQFHVALPVFNLSEQLRATLEQTFTTLQGQRWVIARSTLVVLGKIFLALVMGFYWLNARRSMLDLLLNMSPVRRRSQLKEIWIDVEETLGAYVRGQMVLMLVIGVAAFVGLALLKVPYALALAGVAGLTETIPLIGPFIGGIPAVVLGLSVSPLTGLLVAGWYVLIQQVENHVLVPQVMRHNVGLNPLVVILALAAGGRLNGIVGALLAVPVAGALQVAARHLLIEPAIKNNTGHTREGIVLPGAEPHLQPSRDEV